MGVTEDNARAKDIVVQVVTAHLRGDIELGIALIEELDEWWRGAVAWQAASLVSIVMQSEDRDVDWWESFALTWALNT